MSEPETILCADCTHWDRSYNKDKKPCKKIKMKTPIIFDLLFFLVEFHRPRLATGPDFGCVLGEKNVEKP